MKFHRITGAAILCVLALGGCSAVANTTTPDASDHSDVRARVDVNTETIEMPLDAYMASRDEAQTIDSANRAMRNHCIESEGVAVPSGRDSLTFIPYRPYGLWTMDAATKYGYDVTNPVPEGTQQKYTQEYMDTYQKCSASLSDKLLPLMRGTDNEGKPGLAQQGKSDAHISASQNPLWASIHNDWAECLADNGVSLKEGDEWTPILAEDNESKIRTATIDVECKTQVDVVQKLADLEAQLQAQYIEQNEAALNAERQNKDDIVAEARKVLTSYGK